jgi:flagellar biosynthesis protein
MNEKNNRKQAVALGYDKEKQTAPKVLAKGKGVIAENILQKANEHHIPVQEDASLLALLGKLDIHESIPEELYAAVAEVFAFIYQVDNELAKKK